MKNNKKNIPIAYLVTFRCYATWFHGDKRLSVDPKHNVFGTPRIKENSGLEKAMKDGCIEDKFIMNPQHRETVLQSIIDTCEYNRWYLHAAHVRSNHAHIVLRSDLTGKETRTRIKIYATKYLKRNHIDLSQRKNFWSEEGSAKEIWRPESLFPTMYYVIEEQGGKRMALYYEKEYDEIDRSSYFIF
ncbi:MAG TPA: transposase [Gammaproteobacteria bacterium]|nr:transposase [Gammaproteobacteria bacterium]